MEIFLLICILLAIIAPRFVIFMIGVVAVTAVIGGMSFTAAVALLLGTG